MATRITANTPQVERKILALRRNLTQERMDQIVKVGCWKVHRELVLRTPKKWTGNTRRAWTVIQVRRGHWAIYNKSKIMKFLEYGTQAHGPRRAKFLFIPLNRKTALFGSRAVGSDSFKAGRDYVLKKRVKGIRPRYIVRNFLPQARGIFVNDMRRYVRRVIQTTN